MKLKVQNSYVEKSTLSDFLFIIIFFITTNKMQIFFITLANKDFGPWGKMSVSGVFLDAEFEYLYHPHFSLQVKGLESSAPGQ